MAGKETSRNLGAREAVEAIRGPLSNSELMDRFRISPVGFADLLKQLFQKKLITEEDLARRGIRFKVVKQPEAHAEAQPDMQPDLQQPAMLPPPPVRDHDDEFLDTVTLTELLSFRAPKPSAATVKEEEIPSLEDPPEEKTPDKKGKFSLTGLFKKR
jgi:hypothetical protein